MIDHLFSAYSPTTSSVWRVSADHQRNFRRDTIGADTPIETDLLLHQSTSSVRSHDKRRDLLQRYQIVPYHSFSDKMVEKDPFRMITLWGWIHGGGPYIGAICLLVLGGMANSKGGGGEYVNARRWSRICKRPSRNIGALDAGSLYMSIVSLKKKNVDLLNLSNVPVALPYLGNCHVPCHYLLKPHVSCH